MSGLPNKPAPDETMQAYRERLLEAVAPFLAEEEGLEERPQQDDSLDEEHHLNLFANGFGGLAGLSATGSHPVLQEIHETEVRPLRIGLIRQYGGNADTLLLIDAALSSFLEAKILSMWSRSALKGGITAQSIRRAEGLDKMANRHRRHFLEAMDLLRRPGPGPVRMEIREATNVHVGDQRLEVTT